MPDDESLVGIDVTLGGRTVWSSPRSESESVEGQRQWHIPTGLRWGLRGSGELEVVSRPAGKVIAAYPVVAARGETGLLRLEDSRGTPAIINKWGHLVVPLESDPLRAAQMLRDTAQVMDLLRSFGLRPWLMAGMLLGAVRDGDLLPSEEDGDVGYISTATAPADVALESYRLQRMLEGAGCEVFRQSGTHIQVNVVRSGSVGANVDVFGGFYSGEWLVQPFQVRARIPPAAMEPVTTVELRGVDFAAPADPEPWLEANYGPGWRVPDPAFRFSTPSAGVRRMHGWFGGFIGQREVWDTFYELAASTGDELGVSARALLRGSVARPVLDLGCGAGADSEALARAGRRVWAVDASQSALDLVRQRSLGLPVTAHRVNLAERRETMRFLLDAGLTDVDVLAENLLESMPRDERENVFLLASRVIRNGSMYLGIRDRAGEDHDPHDPRTWFVARREVETLAGMYGFESRGWRTSRHRRGFAYARFTRRKK